MTSSESILPELNNEVTLKFNQNGFELNGEEKPHLYIVGPRSSGKTTLANVIGNELNIPALDLDSELNTLLPGGLGAAIGRAIELNSWDEIQRTTADIVRSKSEEPPFVMAIAGGMLNDNYAAVLENMKSTGHVISIIPGENMNEALNTLVDRERQRSHFIGAEQEKLAAKTRTDLETLIPKMQGNTDGVVYVGTMTPAEIYASIFPAE